MTKVKIQTRTFEKKKGLSTEVSANGKVSDDVMLTIKVAVDGSISEKREEAFKTLIARSFLKTVDENDFKRIRDL